MKKLSVLFLFFISVFILSCNGIEEITFDEANEDNFNEVTDEENSVVTEALRIGMEQYNAGDFNSALDTYTKAIEQIKNNASLYADRGRIKREIGDLDGAIEDINRALELSQEGWIYAERAISYQVKGENKLALEDYEKALSLDPNMDWVKDNIKKLQTQ